VLGDLRPAPQQRPEQLRDDDEDDQGGQDEHDLDERDEER
jgi:hypothetical protein